MDPYTIIPIIVGISALEILIPTTTEGIMCIADPASITVMTIITMVTKTGIVMDITKRDATVTVADIKMTDVIMGSINSAHRSVTAHSNMVIAANHRVVHKEGITSETIEMTTDVSRIEMMIAGIGSRGVMRKEDANQILDGIRTEI
jgi:hypothetical protein